MSISITNQPSGFQLINSGGTLSGLVALSIEQNFELLDSAFNLKALSASSSSGTLRFNSSTKYGVNVAVDTFGRQNILYALSRSSGNACIGVGGIPSLTTSILEVIGDSNLSFGRNVVFTQVDNLSASSTSAVFGSLTTPSLIGTVGNIGTLNGTTGNISTLNCTTGTITNLTVTNSSTTTATATNLVSTNETVTGTTSLATLTVSGATIFSGAWTLNNTVGLSVNSTGSVPGATVSLNSNGVTDIFNLISAAGRTASPSSYLSFDDNSNGAYPVSNLFNIFRSGHAGGMVSSSSSYAFFRQGSSTSANTPAGVCTLQIQVNGRTLYIPAYTNIG